MIIDCDDCQLQHTTACEDCVVAFLLDADDGPVTVDDQTQAALRSLEGAGLAPGSRYRPRARIDR